MKYYRVESTEIFRISEIDRAEVIDLKYSCEATTSNAIQLQKIDLHPPEEVPDWDSDDVERRANWWKKEIDEGGALFFAEDENQLKGFAVLGKEKAGKSSEFVALFIDKDYRGRGIGKKLVELLEHEARDRGIETIYVQSNETASSVDFYLSNGYKIMCLMDSTTMFLPMMETTIILAKKL